MWPALCTGLGGLKPGLSTLPAKYRLVLVTCDAAPANIKLLGHLQSVLDRQSMFFPAQDGECHRKSHDIAGCAYRRIRCGKNASFRSRGLQTGCRGAQHFAGGDANTPADSRWLSRRMGLWPGLREANLGLSEARRWGARRGHLWRVCGVLRWSVDRAGFIIVGVFFLDGRSSTPV